MAVTMALRNWVSSVSTQTSDVVPSTFSTNSLRSATLNE
jgi:hypothetical protein